MLEWVENTIPFGEYMCDKGKKVGAHSKYYPGTSTFLSLVLAYSASDMSVDPIIAFERRMVPYAVWALYEELASDHQA